MNVVRKLLPILIEPQLRDMELKHDEYDVWVSTSDVITVINESFGIIEESQSSEGGMRVQFIRELSQLYNDRLLNCILGPVINYMNLEKFLLFMDGIVLDLLNAITINVMKSYGTENLEYRVIQYQMILDFLINEFRELGDRAILD